MRTLRYEDSAEFICKLMQLATQGEEVEVACPQCGKPLVLAVTRERAAVLGVHPGVFCPTSRNHIYRLFSLTPPGGPPGGSWVDKLLGK